MENNSHNKNMVIVISDSDSDSEDEAQGLVRRRRPISLSNSSSPPPVDGNTPGQVVNDLIPGLDDGNISDAGLAALQGEEMWDEFLQDDDLDDDLDEDLDFLDFDGDAPGVGQQQVMVEDINRRNVAQDLHGESAKQQFFGEPPSSMTKDQCIDAIVELFPEICRTYVSGLYETVSANQEFLIAHILDKTSYPKAKDVQKSLKRKWALDVDEEAAKKYTALNREVGPRVFM